MKHSDYITHINNKEDEPYLRAIHFPVNMRLFQTSPEYKAIILQECAYIRKLCLQTVEGYKKPHGMSSANAGLAFNIIGITINRDRADEYCQIMINPKIIKKSDTMIESESNCGSLTLEKPIIVKRHSIITVNWFDEQGNQHEKNFLRREGSFTIQHEIDHNLGILIIDKQE